MNIPNQGSKPIDPWHSSLQIVVHQSDCSATSYRLCVACIGVTLRSASRSLLLLVGLQHPWRLYTLLSHLSQRRGTSYLCCVCCSWKTIRVVVHWDIIICRWALLVQFQMLLLLYSIVWEYYDCYYFIISYMSLHHSPCFDQLVAFNPQTYGLCFLRVQSVVLVAPYICMHACWSSSTTRETYFEVPTCFASTTFLTPPLSSYASTLPSQCNFQQFIILNIGLK